MQKQFEKFLLVSDMDGTLLTHDFKINPRNLEAIDRFIQKGGYFTVATGRSYQSTGRYIGRLQYNAPAIICNGSAIYDYKANRYLWAAELPDSCEELMRKAMEKFPDVGAEVYHERDVYIVSHSDYTQKHVVDESIPFKKVELSDSPKPWLKALFTASNEELQKIEAYIHTLGSFDFDMVYSGLTFFEALPKGVTKGTTLSELAKLLSVPPERTAGIGDYYNDLDLITRAKYGAAVANAPEDIRQQADVVVSRVEDGSIADFIEYLEEKVPFLG